MDVKIGALALVVAESFISRIIKKLMYRKKKLHAINTIDCDYTKDIFNKMSQNPKIKVVNLDNDYKCLLDIHENQKLEKLKSENYENYKLIVYPIILKFVNLIFKYYCRKYQIIIYSENIELIKYIYGEKNIYIMLPNDEIFNKLTNKNELQVKRVEFYKNYKDIHEYNDVPSAIENIKVSFKIV